MRELRVDAVIGGDEPPPIEIQEVGPAPRVLPLSENREPAFYRIHYVAHSGRIHLAYRVADSEKRACDLVIYSFDPPVQITRVVRFKDKYEMLRGLPVGRGINAVFPPSDLKLAYELGLLEKRETTK